MVGGAVCTSGFGSLLSFHERRGDERQGYERHGEEPNGPTGSEILLESGRHLQSRHIRDDCTSENWTAPPSSLSRPFHVCEER